MKQFAIVGAGEAARFHAKSIQQRGRLVAVCSDGEENARALAQNANAYQSIDELLQKETAVDVVVVCSPVGLHAEHVIKSLQAGKDVLCESPLCLTKAAAWQIIETEKYCGRRLYLIRTPVFSSSLKRLKRAGWEEIGTVRSFQLHCSLRLPEQFLSGPNGQSFPGGGLLYKPYGLFVDLLVSLFGEIETAGGFLTYPTGKTSEAIEDAGVATLKTRNGVIGTINWSGLVGNERRLTITAENGGIEMDLGEPEPPLPLTEAESTPEAIEATGLVFYESVYEELEKALHGEGAAFPGSLEGARTVEAIEKIYKAVR